MITPLKISNADKAALDQGFFRTFGGMPTRYFSAPGRTEIGGNHTDHQHGRVLAAAVDLDTLAAVRPNGLEVIRIQSEGYPFYEINLRETEPVVGERNTTPALVRGIAARFLQLGCPVGGFDAYCTSTVLPGSGLSSSAAFEVLIGTILNHLFFGQTLTPPEVARIGQYAETLYFGKPSGLMDQTVSAVGDFVAIDFADEDHPAIHPVNFDFSACGHALCIIDTRASHADLTDEYATIPAEMGMIAKQLGCSVLSEADPAEFYANLPALRKYCGDRAVLRSIHFFEEQARVLKQVAALEHNDFPTFLELIRESGHSSYMQLQNVIPTGYAVHQDAALALALCKHHLHGKGACRIHGGGFVGTVQAFVPHALLDPFVMGIDSALGEGACQVLSVRRQGGIELFPEH